VKIVYIENTNKGIDIALDTLLRKLGGLNKYIQKYDKVVLKPNFVAPFEKATTDIRIILYLVQKINELNAIPIVAESSGYEFNTEDTFNSLGLYPLVKKHNFELINLDKFDYIEQKTGYWLIPKLNISKIFFDCDVFINLPKLKKHSVTDVTLSMKNLYGCVDRETRRKGHAYGLHKTIYLINKYIKPDLIIMDAINFMDKAVFSKPQETNLILAGTNQAIIDKVACNIIGVNWEKIAHIKYASGSKKNHISKKSITDIMNNKVNCNIDISKSSVMLKLFYKIMYCLEEISQFVFNKSYIPEFHWFFGIRPKIVKNLCDQCGKCLEICPINAINIEKKQIIKNKCMNLRCLKCVDACGNKAIKLKGNKANG
jgi:uncharacterized protein (DUF362 family)/NAD-dependent dihydropyrimidine dehydrogenase PreA subunit